MSSCCEGEASAPCDPITWDLCDATEAGELPEKAVAASLGCGNPTALAEMKAGETVLDLSSGGGIDALLSALPVATDWAPDKRGSGKILASTLLGTWR